MTVSADGLPALSGATVRSATYDLLRAHGMTTVFGNPGSTELGFLAGFPTDFRYVIGLHEGVAVAMADGYAQATGRPAFVNLHSACGVGNAMGAIVNAFHNRAPLVITAGNQDRRHLALEPYLFARSVELAAPYVKRAEQPARAQDVPAAIERAWRLAKSPPTGPVFVSIPADDWNAQAPAALPGEVKAPQGADEDTLDLLAARLRLARRPAIVTGAGVDRAGAWQSVVALAELLGASVWSAPQSPRAGFPEDHPSFRGHLVPGRASAARQLEGSDLALVIGAPAFAFLPFEPDGPPMPTLIHITDDPDEAARAPSALGVVADPGSVTDGLVARLSPRNAGTSRRSGETPVRAPTAMTSAHTDPLITAGRLMATLADLLPANAVLVEESPSNRTEFRRHILVRDPASFFTTASGGLGFAMPAAVGIALADPGRPVVCVVGDGSALYAPQALWNAVQLATPVTFVVVNNGRYAILESVAQFAGFADLPSLELPGVDFVSMAHSFGCAAYRVTAADDLGPALLEAFAGTCPVLIDVVIDPSIAPLLASPPEVPVEGVQ
jgi:benzoylformate decarboxylase